MTTLLAIDPGAHTGMAQFATRIIDDHTTWMLVHAQMVSPDDVDGYATPDIVVLECPNRIFGYARPEDIIKLATVAGRYMERYRGARVHVVAPHDWKGSVDKKIMTARIRAALTPAEAKFIPTCGKVDDIIDAIGLGKWALRQAWMRAR